jgi:hypothetical protein
LVFIMGLLYPIHGCGVKICEPTSAISHPKKCATLVRLAHKHYLLSVA